MARITLNDFAGIMLTTRLSTKLSKIRKIKNMQDYNPVTDFYKPLREQIIALHKKGLSLNTLSQIGQNLSDTKKLSNYPTIISSYQKWCRKKQLIWFSPPQTALRISGDVDIGINPELGLEIKGIPHLIKLYFNKEELPKERARVITNIMALELMPHCEPATEITILDVRRADLIHFDKIQDFEVALAGELASTAAMLARL
jgi:hypothetical protein